MLKKLVLGACALLVSLTVMAADKPHVLLTTSAGEIEVELEADKAPVSVKNFLDYVDAGFYNGTVFHRVIPGFMIQGGGFDTDMSQKDTRDPIKNEADNGLRNLRGTLAMARTQAVNSATSQFFINHNDNAFLDHGSRDFGYAVFGKVVRGMDVVDQIANVPTGNRGMFQNVPMQPVVILSAKRL
ncbi:peptidylprolyl isomerase [Metapseudomonas resinovorans]|uniref:peptidylprolyl isomerase n=1 Tax=Metapseudomonas resinovorans TaxID=53412 RepID=UPI0003F6E98A|nr:peptidylprolyl isomerase [Pseudomonas resinovorans]MDE3739949.1 peptidylprolyl isomerase [Pseudomonas resinovorans]